MNKDQNGLYESDIDKINNHENHTPKPLIDDKVYNDVEQVYQVQKDQEPKLSYSNMIEANENLRTPNHSDKNDKILRRYNGQKSEELSPVSASSNRNIKINPNAINDIKLPNVNNSLHLSKNKRVRFFI